MDLSHGHAQQLDQRDELASFRRHFAFAGESLIYLDGNSLGRPTLATIERLHTVLEEEWRGGLIRSWTTGWYEAPARIGEKIAALLGAGPGQVVASDATTVNLFKLAVAALRARPERHVIVSDVLNFPSDLYVLQGCVDLLGNRHTMRLVPSADDRTIDPQALQAAIDEQVALVCLSHVTFKSGFLHDMAAITRRAHEMGALVLWDVSHSVGAVPLALDQWDVDLAVGCTYKYLSGGPGAPAFLYVRRALQEQLRSPIWGWLGQRAPFDFDRTYEPASGMARFLVGTPPILSLSAVEPALDLLLEAGIERIRRKSVALTSYCIDLFDALLAPLGFTLGSPRDARLRGSHVSMRHPEAWRITRCLIEEMGVLPDYREPDNIRLGLAPLSTTFMEVWLAIDRLRQVVESARYLLLPASRHTVT
ncbi:MAG TPA: kynureninase [Chloroflexota bacterium]|nr:kynureninase [Chloroflexota bacterium]